MKTKKMIMILLIIMLLSIPVSFADDGDYQIPEAYININVTDDASVLITEKMTFDIDGQINGIYRDIPLTGEQSISNISVETPGYYNTVEIIEQKDKTRIKVWLYKDEAKTRKVYDEKVDISFRYTFNKGIKIYNDVAELQVMTWGDQWESKVNELQSRIYIPGSNEGTEYWNNPDDYVISSNWVNSNELVTELEDVPSEKLFEQRILMPTSYFKSRENAQIINMDAKAQIEQDQKKYKEDREFQSSLISIFSGIMALLSVIPLGIYALFGREPKITYNKDYEYDLPTEATPIQVNSIVIGDVDSLDDNAIYATILDLTDKKYFKVVSSNEDDTIIRQTDKDTSGLKSYQKSLINYLSNFVVNGDISLKSIGDTEDPSIYKEWKDSWIKDAKQEVPRSMITRFFDDKGSSLLYKFTIVAFILGVIGIIVSVMLDMSFEKFLMLFGVSMLFVIEAIVLMAIPNTIAGRWTPEGKEFHDKWKNFEKYIKDFSLIKERPPASIQIWGRYLVYAAALGCADEVSKNMKKYFELGGVQENYYYDNNVVLFAYYGGFSHMESSFSSLTQSSTDSDGIGSVGGGGFGGGGGGTF